MRAPPILRFLPTCVSGGWQGCKRWWRRRRSQEGHRQVRRQLYGDVQLEVVGPFQLVSRVGCCRRGGGSARTPLRLARRRCRGWRRGASGC